MQHNPCHRSINVTQSLLHNINVILSLVTATVNATTTLRHFTSDVMLKPNSTGLPSFTILTVILYGSVLQVRPVTLEILSTGHIVIDPVEQLLGLKNE